MVLATGGTQGAGATVREAAGETTLDLATLNAMPVAEVVGAVAAEVQPLLPSTRRRAASWLFSVAVEEESSMPLRVVQSSLQVVWCGAGSH